MKRLGEGTAALCTAVLLIANACAISEGDRALEAACGYLHFLVSAVYDSKPALFAPLDPSEAAMQHGRVDATGSGRS